MLYMGDELEEGIVDFGEVSEIVGESEEPRVSKKRVSIVKNMKQYMLRIPIYFAEQVKIDTDTDEFEFSLTPTGGIDSFNLSGKLLKGVKGVSSKKESGQENS